MLRTVVLTSCKAISQHVTMRASPRADAMRCGSSVFSKLTTCSAVVAIIIAVVLYAYSESAAATYTFTKIVDTSSSQFGRFTSTPSINKQGTVAFFGCTVDCGSANGMGIYKGSGGAVVTIVEEFDNLESLSSPGFINDSDNVSFSGNLEIGLVFVQGVFVGDGGPLTIVADSTGSLDSFGLALINNNDLVAFVARDNLGGRGIFAGSGGGLTTILAATPGSLNEAITINNLGDVAFELDEEIFIGSGGPPISVLDTNGPFKDFRIFSLNDLGRLVVSARLDTGVGGIFSVQNGTVTTLVDSSGSFVAFENVSANNVGGIAFVGQLFAGVRGIFVGPDPVLHKVIAIGDPFFGSTLTLLEFFSRGLNDAGQITFRAILADGTEGIYRAEPPSKDSFRCYVAEGRRIRPSPGISLEDEFDPGMVDDVDVIKAESVCVPVDVNGRGIHDANTVLTCYSIKPRKALNFDVEVSNEFGDDQPLLLRESKTLCVPSNLVVVQP